MDELIRINYDSKRPTVYGRDLHEALQVKTAYKDWFPRMCEYGLLLFFIKKFFIVTLMKKIVFHKK